MLQCRRHEKDFLARRDTAYVSRYVAAYDRVSVGAKDIEIPVGDEMHVIGGVVLVDTQSIVLAEDVDYRIGRHEATPGVIL